VRYFLIGLFTLILFAVYFAPASLVKKGLESNTEISMTNTRGSLWNGSATLSIPGKTQSFELGYLEWSFVPQALFTFCITYRIKLHSETHNFTGQVCRSKDTIGIKGDLNLHSSLLNILLANYDMQVSGLLEISALRLEFAPNPVSVPPIPEFEQFSALVHWSGGPVRYQLGGSNYALNLPAMMGDLGYQNGNPNMKVFENTRQNIKPGSSARIPLILANLDQNGWISIGITKKFTKLLNQPWPGSEPDHAVVLEVQEKLL